MSDVVWPKECIEWNGKRLPKGYGRARICGPNRLVHRHTWEMFNGPIPAGLHVLHSCDNPPCFNVAHLFLGTNADNIADRDSKSRSTWGERNKMSKLTADDVHEIRTAFLLGATAKDLASLYGVLDFTIYKITSGTRWVA